MFFHLTVFRSLAVVGVAGCWLGGQLLAQAPVDPGPRSGASGAGGRVISKNAAEDALINNLFQNGANRFQEVDLVSGGTDQNGFGNGLGPVFNSDSCVSCHSQPAAGGSSPAANPQPQVAVARGGKNTPPWFVVANGPTREARFRKNPDGTNDGGVHDLFVITGRSDAPPTCTALQQPDFSPAGNPLTGQGGNRNIIFRIPTPTFGAGLIEAIPDSAVLANMQAEAQQKLKYQIKGHANAHLSGNANHSANDGTITRFGWKAQNKSLLMFAAEAYNVEMGVTNELFPQERYDKTDCATNATPEDTTNPGKTGLNILSDIEGFAHFMRLLAPPSRGPGGASVTSGEALFTKVGCALCHTASFTTGSNANSALSNQKVNLYSDLLVHNMGEALADGITQGGAGPGEFRSAPLWGVGQRLFFLHDGRANNLVDAIQAHRSKRSEANKVIDEFNKLSVKERQDIINFLRDL